MQKFVIPFTTEQKEQKCLEITSKGALLKKRAVKTWSAKQDQRLVSLYNQYPKKWNIIAQKMHNRNQNQCLHRYRRICQLGQHKKIWSPTQDETVMNMIQKVGQNWKLIAQTLKTKSGKQIRERFINKLDPNIRRDEWTQEEDLKIIELFSKYGSRWCEISKFLPGRPQNRIKNRFYSYIQKNYDFEIKEPSKSASNVASPASSGSSIKSQDKENSLHRSDIRMMSKKSSSQNSSCSLSFVSFDRKSGNKIGILDENVSFNNRATSESFPFDSQQVLSEQKVEKKQMPIEKIQEQDGDNSPSQMESMKQINDQCFFAYGKQRNNCQNDDFLYFEDD